MTAAILDQCIAPWRKLVEPAEQRLHTAMLGGAAAILTLAGSFLNFLSYNHYALARTEVAIDLAALCAVGLLLGLSGALWRVVGRIGLPWLLAMLAVDLNFNGYLPLLIGGVAGLLALRFLRQGLVILFAVVAVTALWTLATAPSPAAAPRIPGSDPMQAGGTQATMGAAARPDIAIVHVILDEHIGVEGIPDSVPGGAELRAKLKQFYTEHGFRVFGGAYSEALHTTNAIPRAFGLAAPGPWGQGNLGGAVVNANPYFDKLQAMGFQIEVEQNDWLDYCQHPAVTACTTRPAGQLIDVGDALPTSDKAAILAYRFITLSEFSQGMLAIYDVIALISRYYGHDVPVVQLLQRTNTSALNGMASFQDAIGAARSIEPGQALFAHVLVPHYPYVFDDSCKVRRLSQWLGRRSRIAWESRYEAYFDQVECATAKVAELIAAVGRSPAAGKAVFIIHGDHGSRITHRDPTAENEGKSTERDLIDGFAAFYAVSAPAIAPGYDKDRYPLRLLLDQLVASGFQSAAPTLPSGFTPTVAIVDSSRTPLYERSLRDTTWWSVLPDQPAD